MSRLCYAVRLSPAYVSSVLCRSTLCVYLMRLRCSSSALLVYLMRLSRMSRLRCSSPALLVYLMRLSRMSRLCYTVRPNASPLLVCLVCLVCVMPFDPMRLSNASALLVFCVARLSRMSRLCYAVRPSWFVSSVPAHIIPLRSFKHVKPVNSFKRLVLLIRSIPNIPSVYVLKHCDALKSISLSKGESPRGSKCLTRLECLKCTESMERLKGFEVVRGFP